MGESLADDALRQVTRADFTLVKGKSGRRDQTRRKRVEAGQGTGSQANGLPHQSRKFVYSKANSALVTWPRSFVGQPAPQPAPLGKEDRQPVKALATCAKRLDLRRE